MKTLKAKAILIDLDGTLVHSAPEITHAANATLMALGFSAQTLTQVTGFIGDGALSLITKCLQVALNAPPNDGLIAQAKTLFFAHYSEVLTQSQPYAGAVESIINLHHAGFKLACITNKPIVFTAPLLRKIGLTPYLHIVVCGDTLPQKKPDPAPLLHACENLNVDINNAIMVGDSITDILAARHAQCRMIVVENGYTQGQILTNEGADQYISKFAEIEDCVMLAT